MNRQEMRVVSVQQPRQQVALLAQDLSGSAISGNPAG
jgi:hypothetical protein